MVREDGVGVDGVVGVYRGSRMEWCLFLAQSLYEIMTISLKSLRDMEGFKS
jgi:hypothetical protein